ncbi:MAG: hypothetical protein JWN15_215 [Firmicutes bacterium]|nr:hypothetical protein [Bacillota bacterium]
MTRTYYRLSLSALCALAACAGPVLFLEDRFRTGYLLGGLGAALVTWLVLTLAVTSEGSLSPALLALAGVGAAVLSWVAISLVAVFDVIPHVAAHGFSRFDPVWLMGGLAPLAILLVARWRMSRDRLPFWPAILSAIYRFSLPLCAVRAGALLLRLPRQYVWLSLFTGVMFLVLDALGAGEDLPLRP